VPLQATGVEDDGKSKMEDPALENAKPPSGKLETLTRDGRRVFAMPSAEAAAFRVPNVRFL
jgi:hypothetical protein